MSQFPSNIDLSGLNGTTGFKFNGVAASDYSGVSVASAGDVNGDGFADLIVGATGADTNGHADSGASYVVFGGALKLAALDLADGFADGTINLSNLDGAGGFKLSGVAADDRSGFSVASAGDINGDGLADVIVGARDATINGNSYSGAAYVVFGKSSGFASNIDLSSLDGTTGFRFAGGAAFEQAGQSLSSAGDVNGDGIADFIVGASLADNAAGASYVVFGGASNLAALDLANGAADGNISLSSLNGTTGYRLSGVAPGDTSGFSVAAAGDVNGDGFVDLIVGANNADPHGSSSGASYVVFGGASNLAALDLANGATDGNISLSSLNGTTGYKFSGVAASDFSGHAVAGGDINGDGFADLIISADNADPHGSSSGATYVVFGGAANLAALDLADGATDGNIDLSMLNGTTGFKLSGEAANNFSGHAISAGDVNGDGFADVIVGADGVNSFAGASYVVFGKASGFAANIDLSTLDGTNGFRVSGEAAGDLSGFSVAAAGDVNQDGLADLIVGAESVDANGNADAGASYVVYGRLPDTAVNRIGTNASQNLVGGDFADTLAGLGGQDALYGHGGNDTLDGGSGNDTLQGGDGNDNLFGGAGNDALFGDTLGGAVGNDVMTGGAGDDAYFVNSPSDVVSENPNEGTDVIHSFINLTLPDNVEILALLSPAAIGTGNALDNRILGNALDNVIDGGAGADFMRGHAGNDTYVVDNAGDVVSEDANEGTDTVNASISDTLGANVENLTLTGGADLQGYGNGLANILQGNSGNNLLNGDTGADAMFGGTGNDVYFVDNAGDGVFENAPEGNDSVFSSVSFTLGANVENLILQGSVDLQGYGNGDANVIYGNTGNNLLNGLAGIDLMAGGAGDDVYFADESSDACFEVANQGNDSVFATTSYGLAADVEGLILQGSGDFQAYGSNQANTIYGNTGNNLINAGGGIDLMAGGLGDDVYYVDDPSDACFEVANQGNDSVFASASYGLAADVENLILQGSADLQAYGSSQANTIYGNSGSNLINGGAGADLMVGGAGNDVYFVDNAGDGILESANEGNDSVFAGVSYALSANVEGLVLQGAGNIDGIGNALANVIAGNTGDNTLDGGGGIDQLTGNAGNDTFVFRPGEANGDVVVDFAGNGAAAGDQLSFIGYGGGATFTNIDATHWQVNYSGGSSHDIITFMNSAPIDANDYLLN